MGFNFLLFISTFPFSVSLTTQYLYLLSVWVVKVLKATRSFFQRFFRNLFEKIWERVGGEDVRERIEQLREEYEKWRKEREEECEKWWKDAEEEEAAEEKEEKTEKEEEEAERDDIEEEEEEEETKWSKMDEVMERICEAGDPFVWGTRRNKSSSFCFCSFLLCRVSCGQK